MKRVLGHVKWFDIDKGFGFLVLEDGGGDVLLHANVLKNFGRTSVSEDTKIEFEFLETDKGRQVSKIYNILNSEDIKNPKENDHSVNKINDFDLHPARVKWFNKSKGFSFSDFEFLFVNLAEFNCDELIAGLLMSTPDTSEAPLIKQLIANPPWFVKQSRTLLF